MLEANINLDVPNLPDNEVWFADAAAWKNYFKDINVTVSFDGAVTQVFVPSIYNVGLNFVRLNIDGDNQDIPSYAQHQSLVAAFTALYNDYVNLKTALKNAGFITQV